MEAAHRSEIVAESVVRHYSHHQKSKVNKPYEKVSKLEHEAAAADQKLQVEKAFQANPEAKKGNMNRHYQKQHIKKDYAAAWKSGSQTASTASAKAGKTVRERHLTR